MPVRPALPNVCRQCLNKIRNLSSHRQTSTQWFPSSRALPACDRRRIIEPRRHASTAAAAASSIDTKLISPALLARARATQAEHETLTVQNAESFSPQQAKRIGELSTAANAYSAYRSASEALAELRALIADPTADEELQTLAHEDLEAAQETASNAAKQLTQALVRPHPFAHLPCLLEIRPGVGGGEAALFASDLLRMYMAYLPSQGFSASILKREDAEGASDASGSEAPLQEAIIEVTNAGAYGLLRCESGVHRVQRVPATETKGRTHTSAASVVVLPSLANQGASGLEDEDINDPNSDYYVNPTDVRTDVMRSSGAGGQHVNKTESAVRLTHVPTNTVVAVSTSRSQLQNRAKAWDILRARLAQSRREEREEEVAKVRMGATGGKTVTGGRSEKIRTYNWGQKRVTDHRSGITLNRLDDVVEGGDALHEVMESARAWMVDMEVQGLLADAEVERKKKQDKT